jgi:hypothetical protein
MSYNFSYIDYEEKPDPDPPEPEPPPDGTPYPECRAITVIGPEDDDPDE